ncbi:hypothetical protein DV735_g4307, partial [Chaetothyriales sp. CBS 134920]
MSTTTTTTAHTVPPMRNPKDSMKSTWRTDRSQWGFPHWFFELVDIQPSYLDKEAPVFSKDDPVAVVSEWQNHRWILVHALAPIVLQQLYVSVTGRNLSFLPAFLLYSTAYKLIGIRNLHLFRYLGLICGYLDGEKHPRDSIPDHSVGKVLMSLISTSTLRSVMTIMLAYRTNMTPSTISWVWLPLEIGLYGIILDFWFYWYHRLMHDNDMLWKFHRTHHLTKHPNPLLTLYADTVQEIFDIAVIPFLTYGTMKLVGLPMGFYEWWLCHQYIMFTELAGHSGLRMVAAPPSTLSWLLELFDAELLIEDHDLHHRKGWRQSHNYGKQTRLWDKLFGTCHRRIEMRKENIDYNNILDIPLWF